MRKDLFNAIVLLATQGKDAEICDTKVSTEEKFCRQVLDELELTLENLSSDIVEVRKKAISTLLNKACMSQMRNDAPIAREWFLIDEVRCKIFEIARKEQEEAILCNLFWFIGHICENWSFSSKLCFGDRPTNIEYLKDGYELFSFFMQDSRKEVQFIAAIQLTFFRQQKAWDYLYNILCNKPNQKKISSITSVLFRYGILRLRSLDAGDFKVCKTFDELQIEYNKEGISVERAKDFCILLQQIWKTRKLNEEVQDGIMKAFSSIGTSDTIDFIKKQMLLIEEDSYLYDTSAECLEDLQHEHL